MMRRDVGGSAFNVIILNRSVMHVYSAHKVCCAPMHAYLRETPSYIFLHSLIGNLTPCRCTCDGVAGTVEGGEGGTGYKSRGLPEVPIFPLNNGSRV